MKKIGVIAADQMDFIAFCKEHGIYIASDLIINLYDVDKMKGHYFCAIYITESAIKAGRQKVKDFANIMADKLVYPDNNMIEE
jgi:hypothetical protein